ncbi:MAG TPA: helix-turn-helix domain-containing protein [Steroidobacteraceae bacterium]|nr:helix-turn-helix domain-containing protein [Steroidobacteraceae bacterium]
MARAALRRIPDYYLYGEARRGIPGRFVHVETIEARSALHHWKIEPHLHRSMHQIVLVSQGRGIAQAEGAVAHFQPPAVIFAPAGAVHGYAFEPGTLGFVVTFAEELLADLARREAAVARLFAAPQTLEMSGDAPDTAALMRVTRALAREHAQRGAGGALALEGWLSVLLTHILRVAQALLRPADASLSRSRQLVTRFRNLIESGFRSNLPIPHYAQALRVSEARLRNACLSAAGQPPIRLVHARILLEAKRQLVYTVMPVTEVAYTLGFDDPTYFTRFFTRRVGVCPRRYRARGLQE